MSRIKRFNDYRHIKVEIKLCECGCGEFIPKLNKQKKLARFKHGHNWQGLHHSVVSRKKISAANKVNKWKGGRVMKGGYIKIYKPEHHYRDNVYVMEHRLVWENHNNAILLPWADIHHKNHIRTDNRIENLEAMTKGQHTALHNKLRYS